jgi:predicted nucleotidyltransferase component of viral defense system
MTTMTRESLRLAVEYTAQITGFSPRLIEKDYYCSLVLKHLSQSESLRNHLIFKGGTLLAKGLLGFFRLSEDLDFSVSNSFCEPRKQRRELADAIKISIGELLTSIGFHEVSPLRGFNESRQYNGVFGYTSIMGTPDTIKFEVGFRGDLMTPPADTPLATLLADPFSRAPAINPIICKTLAPNEAYAEKARAALSRRTPAIRDLFDLAQIAKTGFALDDQEFIALVSRKLEADNSASCNTSTEKKSHLLKSVETDLAPVLKIKQEFDFDDAWEILENLAQLVTTARSG